MARRKIVRRKSKYTRLYGYTKKIHAIKDASVLRKKGHSVRIRIERGKVGSMKGRKIYGIYTTD